MGAIGRLAWLQIDCRDPKRLAAFWGAVFGLKVDNTFGEPPHYVVLAQREPVSPYISFQRVPEPKTVKNRLHFDLWVDDIERATTQIETLSGRRLSLEDFQEYGFRWRVMADPEGNEFCLIYKTSDKTIT